MSERGLFLEAGLAAVLILGAVFFGAVYAWTFMGLYALLFLFFFIYPHALLTLSDFPRLFKLNLLLLFLFPFCQLFFISFNRFQTGEEILKWLALASAFLLTQLFSISQLRRLLWILVILGICEVCYGWIQIQSGAERILWCPKNAYLGYLTGTFIYRNHLAGLLEICLGIQLGFLAEASWQKDFKKIIGNVLIFGILMTGLFKTGSRMGLVSFLAAFLFFLPLFFRKFPNRTKIAIFAWMVMAMAVIFYGTQGVFFARFADLGNALRLGEGRWWVWRDVFRMFRDHLWGGIGLGGFKWLYPGYQSQVLLLGWTHAHNDYLELLTELGIFGFFFLCAGFFSLWVFAIGKLRRTSPKDFFIPWGIFVAVAAFSVHGMTDFNWAVPANNIITVTVLGLAVRALALSETGKKSL